MKIAVWLLTSFAAAAACALVVSSQSSPTPIDRALPLIAVLISIASFLALRFGEIAITSIPVLTVLAAVVPEDRLRLLLYGIAVAAALIVVLCGMVERVSLRIDLWRAVGFVLVCAALLKAIPSSPGQMIPLATLFAGLAALLFVLGGSTLSIHVIPVVLAVALITPLEPSRAAIFPIVLACALGAARFASLPFLLVALILAVPSGKWALLLVVLCSAAPLLASLRRRGSALIALPAVKGTWTVLLRTLLFSPATIADTFTAPRVLTISAVLLSAVALFVRPAIALMYLISAVAVVLPLQASPARLRMAIPSGIFAATWLTLFAWSGALAPAFPVLFTGVSGPTAQVIGRALAAGESVVIQPAESQPRLFLITSGSNVASLSPDLAVARLEFADRRGQGFARDVKMGEIADWGAFRPAHFFGTRNELPRRAALLVDGFGSDAFVAGFSRLELKLDQPIDSIRVTALPGLPRGATVELHRLELPN